MPKRIQMSRQHPWRADNPDAVIVARPTKWGNPWSIKHGDDLWEIVERDPELGDTAIEYAGTMAEARQSAVDTFRAVLFDGGVEPPEYPSVDEIRTALAGKDLACWCPIDQPCHADVLLELANGGA